MQKKFFLLFLAMLLLSLGTLGGCDGSSSGNKNSTSPPSPEPPQWSSGYPDAVTVIDTVNINHQDASFKVMLDKQCTVYYVVVASGDTEPEPDQISSGLNGAGTAAFLSGNTAVPADTETAITISGLEYSQSYDIHLIAEDSDSNFQETSEMITADIGNRNIIFVSESSGNDSNNGDDPEYPKESISAGLTAAGLLTGSCIKVYVSAGTYAESVTLENGVSLYGGFSATDWSDRDIEDRGNATYSTEIQGVASSMYGVAFSGSSSEQWILEGFTITTSHPDNSHGVRVYLDGGTATVRYNTINGGTGTNESNGIYVNGPESKMIVQHNEINGGASTGASSNGIYIETAADQIVTDNTIDGGSGNSTSRGITATYPLASTSLIARNDINGGSSSTSYGIYLYHYTDNTTLACEITGNHIDGGTGASTYGIHCTGTADTRAVAPLICNNVIEATGSSLGRGLYLMYTEETVRVYNNTITVSGTSNYSCGIYAMGLDVRHTTVDVQNNIMIGLSPGGGGGNDVMLYYANSEYAIYSPVKNNVFWGTFIDSNHDYEQIATFNALSDEIDGNMVIDPVDLALDADYDFTSTSPASVTEGGLDLSGVADFPENTGGDKIDYSGTARTSPWSIGAYESD